MVYITIFFSFSEIRTEAVKEALMNHHKKSSMMPMSCKRTSGIGQSRPTPRLHLTG